MRKNKELDDVLTEERSMNYRKISFWGDKRKTKDDMVLHVMRKKLLGSVGKKWDKVYSKLVKEIPDRLRDSITSNWLGVEEAPMIINGVVYDAEGRFELSDRLYVDHNGILKRAPKIRYKKIEKPACFVNKNDKIYTTIKDIWYELFFEEWDKVKHLKTYRYFSTYHNCHMDIDRSWANDLIIGRTSKHRAGVFWGKYVICTKKIQCGKKTAKKLNEEFKNKLKPKLDDCISRGGW